MGWQAGKRYQRGVGRLLPALALGLLVAHPEDRTGAIAAPAAQATTSPTPATTPPRLSLAGYFVDSSQALARRPTKSKETTGDFTYAIHRGFPDSTSGRLLGIAEATYPPRDLLTRIAAEKQYEVGSDSAGVPLWWCQGIGESRIPYAITAGALDHYLRLTRLFRDRLFQEAGTQPIFWSDLSYRATIAKRDSFVMGGKSFPDVYVAQLTLNWTYDDGTFMPSTRAHRTVVLSPNGEIKAVDGDGATEESVSISIHRGVGRQEKMLR